LRARFGLSLIEVLLIIVALGMVLVMSASLLAGAYKIEAAAGEAFRRQNCWSALADQFRADAGQARDAPDRFDTYSAGPTCLVLHKADGRHVVYYWSDAQLERVEWNCDDDEIRRIMPLGSERASVEFSRGPAEGLVRLRIVPPPDPGTKDRFLEIAAALGGDLR
jgi:hypothetical protein